MNHDCLIDRIESTEQGTFGRFYVGGWETVLWSLELPWRENQRRISCIPEGHYFCAPWNSARWPNTYVVLDVEGRSGILTHAGNLAGDTSQGFKTHSLGCILPGKQRGVLQGQRAVLMSGAAMNVIRRIMGRKSFELVIRGNF